MAVVAVRSQVVPLLQVPAVRRVQVGSRTAVVVHKLTVVVRKLTWAVLLVAGEVEAG